jgi:hypothetical protein
MPYPSDLSDTEWLLVEDFFAVGNYGTSRKHEVRALLNAVFYLTKTGCRGDFYPMISHLIQPFTVFFIAPRKEEFGSKCSSDWSARAG